jgi:hypothetical protein
MRAYKRFIPYLAGITLVLTIVGILKTPKVSAAIRATFVEIVIPTNTFNASMQPSFGVYPSVGPDTGTLGVTSLLITNFSGTPQSVLISAPLFANGGGCGGIIIGREGPILQVYVQPLQTLSIAYPTPLTFRGAGGHTCLAALSTTGGQVEVDVNGFVN